MSSYPLINDTKFYDKINKIYKRFTIPKNKLSINEYCNPREFTLQKPQEFVSEYINPKTPYKSILIYHRIGAGKTCAAIQIAEKWKKLKKIIFVLPASLKGNLKDELRGNCGNYLTSAERTKLKKYNPYDKEYIDIIKLSDRRIEEYYNIYSYNKFIDDIKEKKINLQNSILFIDEIQNMVSQTGTYYSELYKLIHNSSSNLRIVLLSATPMFDQPHEIALTINLLRPTKEIPTGKEFENMFIHKKKLKNKTYYSVKNINIFKKLIKGYISYYNGAPSYTYPEMTVKYVECEMSKFQYDVYKKLLKNNDILKKIPTKDNIISASDLPNNFYIGTRYCSNIVYPNKKINENGIQSLTQNKIINKLSKYSCKLDKLISNIKRSRGKIFIYSSFKDCAGLKTVIKVLEAFGYKNYSDYGIGKKRFAIWSGDESIKEKDEIKAIYNRVDNLYGNKLRILLGSPAIKEGVSLKAVRFVHILEPYWNISRLEQVIGRASRYCSHIDLPENERNVKVYIYIAMHSKEEISIDQYIKKMSDTKNKIIKQFEHAIKESAIDCHLNYNANKNDNDGDLKCN